MAFFLKSIFPLAKANRAKVRKRMIKTQKIKTESYKTKKHLQNEYDSFIEPNNKFSNEYEFYNKDLEESSEP